MLLDEILERNRTFVRGGAVPPFPSEPAARAVVVACFDPRLDDLLLPSLGMRPGEAVVLRTAGALVRPGNDPLRSLAVAVHRFAIRDVLVVGHAACYMAAFDTAGFIDSFRKRGVARDAFGSEDLRAWAGALASPAAGVETSVAAIRSAPILPRDLMVAGLLLDERTGSLTPVVRPDQPVRTEAPSATPVEAATAPEAGAAPDAGGVPSAPGKHADPRVRESARSLVRSVVATAELRDEVRRLRAEMGRHSNPLTKLGLLRAFLAQAASQSREVRGHLDALLAETGAPHPQSREEILEIVRALLDEVEP
jgi:carbonic anhydrase